MPTDVTTHLTYHFCRYFNYIEQYKIRIIFALCLAFENRPTFKPRVEQLKTLFKDSGIQAALGLKHTTFQSPVQNITVIVENLGKGVINIVLVQIFSLLTAHPVDVTWFLK